MPLFIDGKPSWIDYLVSKSKSSGIFIYLPQIGIETIAKNRYEIIVAIEEAIESFWAACEYHGDGFERELLKIKENGNGKT